MADSGTVLMPMMVDCFVLNKAVCSPTATESAKVAPITQPNYTFLRYDQQYLASDILPRTDLHGTDKSSSNPRFTNFGTGKEIESRQGVYVHWLIPRPYRAGVASTGEQTSLQKSRGQLPPETTNPQDKDKPKLATPQFLNVPTRWLVIRHTDLSSVEPRSAVQKSLVPELSGWVIESDHQRSLDELGEEVDLQVDVSPYITPTTKIGSGERTDKIDIDKQAEVFIGSKWPAETWPDIPSSNHKRVPLSVANSSNQLFPDFQPHNGNVFSMLDTLQYIDNTTAKRIESAKISYYVYGWHSDPTQDLFFISDREKNNVSRGSRLDALNMVLDDPDSIAIQDWRNLNTSTLLLCHGTKYDVEWDIKVKPVVPADDYCKALMENSTLAVGTKPLDSILAYARGHISNPGAEGLVEKLIQDLTKLEAQLVARDDSVEKQRRAINEISNASFKRLDGGKHLYFADTQDVATNDGTNQAKGVKFPTDTEQEDLLQFNKEFIKSDTADRLASKLRWDMFALWWSLLSDRGETEPLGNVEDSRGKLRKSLEDVISKITVPKDKDGKPAAELKNVQAGVTDPFYQPSDPMLLVAGVPSAWPHDFLDKLVVRLDSQSLHDDEKTVLPPLWNTFFQKIIGRIIPSRLLKASRALLEEFLLLRPGNDIAPPNKPRLFPLYHDHPLTPSGDLDKGHWRDSWNSAQPFFPLYIEWEVQYIHIPFQYWKVQDTTSSPSQESSFRYVVDTQKFLDQTGTLDNKTGKKDEGQRILTGRSLILPHPGFSLESKVLSLFSQVSESHLDELLNKGCRDALKSGLRQLPFLSTPLSGFTDHLITRLHGTHVKPNNRAPNGPSIPIQAAIDAATMEGCKFKERDLELIAEESDLTPYSSTIQYEDTTSAVFKPVTHGQFRFTKLNIIDKFGQAIHAIDPSISEKIKSTTPCVSEYFAAQRLFEDEIPIEDEESLEDGDSIDDGDFSKDQVSIDVVVPKDYNYIQIPPQINQYARLNASFVELFDPKDGGDLYWRPTTEWQNPVWGWVVINRANYGLQFFLGNGTFYREVRVGGPRGTLASAEWLPFRPNKFSDDDPLTTDPRNRQLQALIQKLHDSDTYLKAFVGMIDGCMSTLMPAPPAYSEQMSSVVGRPLALVNTGWSLELATERYRSHLIGDKKELPCYLADKDSITRNPSKTPLYSFPMKLGSKEKAYDGLIGYFPAQTKPKLGDALNLQELYTYYGKTIDVPINPITEDTYPRLYPYYFDPTYAKRSINDLYTLRCKEQHVFGAVIDPFASIHAYTSILPTKELQLVPWVAQSAFAKMTTFFRIGPLLLQKDVPKADAKGQVPVDEVATGKKGVEPKLGIPVPASTLGVWNWLQPYYKTSAGGGGGNQGRESGSSSGGAADEPSEGGMFYTRLKLDKIDQQVRFEETPYTATEGFLQLCKPAEK